MSTKAQLNKASLEAYKARLAAAHAGLRNDGVVMKAVAVFLDQWVHRNFRSKGANVGGWAPYTYGGRVVRKSKANAQSIQGKKWINGTAVLLRDTGLMEHSFLPFVRKGIAGIGSDLPYSKPHNEGDSDRNLAKRRMLPESSEVDVQVNEILENFVAVQIRKARS
jgi:hypothetical protein